VLVILFLGLLQEPVPSSRIVGLGLSCNKLAAASLPSSNESEPPAHHRGVTCCPAVQKSNRTQSLLVARKPNEIMMASARTIATVAIMLLSVHAAFPAQHGIRAP
jgi:hypothetical protein